MANKSKKQLSLVTILISFFLLVLAFTGLIFLQEKLNPKNSQGTEPSSLGSTTSSSKALDNFTTSSDLPKVKTADWNLVLVNRDNTKEEMTPALADVSNIKVDSRIAEATTNFLTAAQAIDANVHLISGYRSVEEQRSLYEGYIQQEMKAQGINQEAAETVVQTYSQPAGASEHMTGLAIDMSTADSLNQMDEEVAAEIAAIAPDYGFVLRYKSEYAEQTGIGYEDWHFRYVGNESARYMTDHNVSLEAYLNLLNDKTGQ